MAASIGAGAAVVGAGSSIYGAINGSTGAPAQSTSTNTLPSWLTTPEQTNAAAAQSLAQTPYNSAMNYQVAGFNPQQTQAFSGISALQGQYQQPYSTALGNTQQLGNQATQGLNNSQFSSYMNPYIQQVNQASNTQSFQNLGIAQNQLSEQAAGSGAFGNDRLGLAQGQLSSNALMNMNAQNASNLAGGFNTALGGYQTGINQGLSAAGQMGSLASNQQTTGLQGLSALQGAGATQQQYAQQQMTATQQNALQQAQYPWQQLANAQNIMTPMQSAYSMNSGTQIGQQPSMASQISSTLTGLAGSGALTNAVNGYNTLTSYNPTSLNSGIVNYDNSSMAANPTGSMAQSAWDQAYAERRGGQVPGYAKGGGVSANAVPGAPGFFHMMNRFTPHYQNGHMGYRQGGMIGYDDGGQIDPTTLSNALMAYSKLSAGERAYLPTDLHNTIQNLHQNYPGQGGESTLNDAINNSPLFNKSVVDKGNNRTAFEEQGGQGIRRGGIAGYAKGGMVDPSKLTHGYRTGGLLHKAPHVGHGHAVHIPSPAALAGLHALAQQYAGQQGPAGSTPAQGLPNPSMSGMAAPGAPQPQIGLACGGMVPSSIRGYDSGGAIDPIAQALTNPGNNYSLGDLVDDARANNYVNQLLGGNSDPLPQGYRKGGIAGYDDGGLMPYTQNGSAYQLQQYQPNYSPLQDAGVWMQNAGQIINPERALEGIVNTVGSGAGAVSNYLNTPNNVAAAQAALPQTAAQATAAMSKLRATAAVAKAGDQPVASSGTGSSAVSPEEEAYVDNLQRTAFNNANNQPQGPIGPYGTPMNLPELAMAGGMMQGYAGHGNTAADYANGMGAMAAQAMQQKQYEAMAAYRNGMINNGAINAGANAQRAQNQTMDQPWKQALQSAQAQNAQQATAAKLSDYVMQRTTALQMMPNAATGKLYTEQEAHQAATMEAMQSMQSMQNRGQVQQQGPAGNIPPPPWAGQ